MSSNHATLPFLIVLTGTLLLGCPKNEPPVVLQGSGAPSSSASSPSAQTSATSAPPATAPDDRCGGPTNRSCPPGQACKIDPKDKDGFGSCGPAGAPPKF